MNLNWIPETAKIISEGINEVMKDDKVLGFFVVIILAYFVSKLPQNVNQGVLEWFKMALSMIAAAITGYSLGKMKR